jgi:hypothetical protein
VLPGWLVRVVRIHERPRPPVFPPLPPPQTEPATPWQYASGKRALLRADILFAALLTSRLDEEVAQGTSTPAQNGLAFEHMVFLLIMEHVFVSVVVV